MHSIWPCVKKTPSRYRILQIDRGKKVFLKETNVLEEKI